MGDVLSAFCLKIVDIIRQLCYHKLTKKMDCNCFNRQDQRIRAAGRLYLSSGFFYCRK